MFAYENQGLWEDIYSSKVIPILFDVLFYITPRFICDQRDRVRRGMTIVIVDPDSVLTKDGFIFVFPFTVVAIGVVDDSHKIDDTVRQYCLVGEECLFCEELCTIIGIAVKDTHQALELVDSVYRV